MVPETRRVAIVVDPNFGDQLSDLSERAHLWVQRSDKNDPVSQRIRAAREGASGTPDLSTFTASDDDPATAVLEILPTVQLHEGELSQDPPWSLLEVYGASPTPELESELGSLGFSNFSNTPHGFSCERDPSNWR